MSEANEVHRLSAATVAAIEAAAHRHIRLLGTMETAGCTRSQAVRMVCRVIAPRPARRGARIALPTK